MSNVVEVATAMFKCPICKVYMWPPIYQCKTGHCLCNRCYNYVTKCPQCGEEGVGTRAVILEEIHSRLYFPCRYYKQGCTVTLCGLEINAHQTSCKFVIEKCPLWSTLSCEWSGVLAEMKDHCLEQHQEQTICGESETLVRHIGFKTRRQPNERAYVLHAYGTMFRFNWAFEDTSYDCSKFAVYYYGYPVDKARFSYVIRILDKDTGDTALKFEASCKRLVGNPPGFFCEHYVVQSFLALQNLCCGEDLRYTIKIIDNEGAKIE